MTVASAMRSASIRLIGRKPQAFFGASGAFEAELCDLANEVAEDIAQYQDWQELVRVGEVIGDGVTTEFDLPDDYGRMLVKSDVQDLQSWAFGYGAYDDINAFLYAEASGFTPFPGGWIIYANKMRFAPAPTQTASFPYITKNWARPASGDDNPTFTADTDTFLLPERLLTLALVWRWRENKKLDATGDQEAFVKALDEYAAKNKGSRSYARGRRRTFPNTHAAWPWELG